MTIETIPTEIAKVTIKAMSDGRLNITHPDNVGLTLQVIAGAIAALSEKIGREESRIVKPTLVVK